MIRKRLENQFTLCSWLHRVDRIKPGGVIGEGGSVEAQGATRREHEVELLSWTAELGVIAITHACSQSRLIRNTFAF